MAIGPINTAELEAAVTEAETGAASVEVFIQGVGDRMQAAVTAALTADNAADQGSVDAANAAIVAEVARLKGASARIVTALAA